MYPKFPPDLMVGTSSWSSPDWCGSFYPDPIGSSEMTQVYSSKLQTVEIDSTWYHLSNRTMIEPWKARIPPIKHLLAKGIPVYACFNNQYAGYAPGSMEFFEKLIDEDTERQHA
jgi:uncharacterized protein YecE (DUF72 family)